MRHKRKPSAVLPELLAHTQFAHPIEDVQAMVFPEETRGGLRYALQHLARRGVLRAERMRCGRNGYRSAKAAV